MVYREGDRVRCINHNAGIKDGSVYTVRSVRPTKDDGQFLSLEGIEHYEYYDYRFVLESSAPSNVFDTVYETVGKYIADPQFREKVANAISMDLNKTFNLK